MPGADVEIATLDGEHYEGDLSRGSYQHAVTEGLDEAERIHDDNASGADRHIHVFLG